MTYCVAIKLNSGIVFCSDSRTNAGPDQVSTYSKMHRWGIAGQRQFTLLSAGNLATTQSVLTRVHRDIKEGAAESLATMRYMSDAANYIGEINVEERSRHATDDGANAGFNPEATFILGGQIEGETSELCLIYPEGNHISASGIVPFLQIGETKYGKPILDRIIRPEAPMDAAIRCALVSMDSTMRSNVSVGPPIELNIYTNDSFEPGCYRSLQADDPYLTELKRAWDQKVVQAFRELPELEMECLPRE